MYLLPSTILSSSFDMRDSKKISPVLLLMALVPKPLSAVIINKIYNLISPRRKMSICYIG